MVSNRRPGYSSAFDEMLGRNRERLEELYAGRGSSLAGTGRQGNSLGDGPYTARPVAQTTEPDSAAAVGSSETVRFLDDRYGDGWRYEVADRRRDGDEFIVLCKLILADQNISKSQFGRAHINSSGDGHEITGSADGVAFAIQPEEMSRGRSTVDPEEAAFHRAVERALARCVELL